MKRNISESHFSPASQPPENGLDFPTQLSMSTENHTLTPLVTNLHTSDQAVESALSRLTLSQEFEPHVLTPSFLCISPTIGGTASPGSVTLPVALGEKQQPLFLSQFQSNNGGGYGPLGFIGAHHNINGGPEALGFLRSGSNLVAGGDTLNMLQYCSDATCSSYDSSSLHDKKPWSRDSISDFPALVSAQQSNFFSPRHSLYGRQFSKQWKQAFTPEKMTGIIVTLAQDETLSGVLNSILEKGLREEEIEMILLEVMDSLVDLLRNGFGSLFVHKLFVVCNEDQRTRIILALTKFPYKLITSCLDSDGSRAVQKLLGEMIKPQQIALVVSVLSLGAITLSTQPNGQHVIQYCVKSFPAEYNKHIFNEIAANCYRIAVDKNGCCVVQSCIEKSDREAREHLISNILANAVYLAEDRYGNYVVQRLVEMKIEKATAELLRKLKGHFLQLSCNKFASNVVEKFLLVSGEKHSATIINELLASPEVSMLLIDPYGNFVIQSALSASTGRLHEALLHLIQDNRPLICTNLYGRRILAALEKKKHRGA